MTKLLKLKLTVIKIVQCFVSSVTLSSLKLF